MQFCVYIAILSVYLLITTFSQSCTFISSNSELFLAVQILYRNSNFFYIIESLGYISQLDLTVQTFFICNLEFIAISTFFLRIACLYLTILSLGLYIIIQSLYLAIFFFFFFFFYSFLRFRVYLSQLRQIEYLTILSYFLQFRVYILPFQLFLRIASSYLAIWSLNLTIQCFFCLYLTIQSL